jgi:hypothetical protein
MLSWVALSSSVFRGSQCHGHTKATVQKTSGMVCCMLTNHQSIPGLLRERRGPRPRACRTRSEPPPWQPKQRRPAALDFSPSCARLTSSSASIPRARASSSAAARLARWACVAGGFKAKNKLPHFSSSAAQAASLHASGGHHHQAQLPLTLHRAGWQVYRGRHLHRDVAVKVLRLDGGLAHAVQREVRRGRPMWCIASGRTGNERRWNGGHRGMLARCPHCTGPPKRSASSRRAAVLRRQVQLAERVSRDANVVQVYGAALAEDGRSVMLVMELMQVMCSLFVHVAVLNRTWDTQTLCS